MGKKKESKQGTTAVEDGLCHPDGCPFFSLEPEILEDEIVDGVRQRKVKRLCLYDLSEFKSGWKKQCPKYQAKRRREKENGKSKEGNNSKDI